MVLREVTTLEDRAYNELNVSSKVITALVAIIGALSVSIPKTHTLFSKLNVLTRAARRQVEKNENILREKGKTRVTEAEGVTRIRR